VFGRCDKVPATYLTAKPITRPPITVSSSVTMEERNAPTCTIAYTAIACGYGSTAQAVANRYRDGGIAGWLTDRMRRRRIRLVPVRKFLVDS
jgi:hypothetical protein